MNETKHYDDSAKTFIDLGPRPLYLPWGQGFKNLSKSYDYLSSKEFDEWVRKNPQQIFGIVKWI